MLDIAKIPPYIILGNQRDFGHALVFDVSAWDILNADNYKISYKRPGEASAYEAATVYDAIAQTLTWTIDGAATDISGMGSLVIGAYRGTEQLTHSDEIQTAVGEGHAAAVEPPAPMRDWWDALDARVSAVEAFEARIAVLEAFHEPVE